MTESDRGWGKLVQAGNMIEGNHFQEAFTDETYYKVYIPLDQAMYEKDWKYSFIQRKVNQSTTKDIKRMYFMQFPRKGEHSYFVPKRYGILPEIVEYYGAMDPALGKATSTSMTAIIVLGVDKDGFIYEIESHIDKIKPDDAMDMIINLPYTFSRFGIEDVQFQQYLRELITVKANNLRKYIPFEGITQRRSKQERIESVEPTIKAGLIKFRGNNDLWNEMVDYPDSDHLDGIDVLEMCFRLIKDRDWAG
jgi:predicted phage terminase large subunit-like protein